MKNKVNVTVIIPVHDVKTKDFDTYFENAVKSIANNSVLPEKVIIIAPEEIASYALFNKGHEELNIQVIVNKGATDFASQMNTAVDAVETEYFSFLEFDDEYSDLWFRNVEKYIGEYPDISVYLPIISDANEEKKFLGYTNEIAWAYEFTDKHGIVDAETLKDYPNFNPDGMVMRVADFKRIGGYKNNIKLTFNLEFLLRACDQALQVMVIPKIGYQHTNMRANSLFWDYKNGDNKLTPEESAFWLDVARREFYYSDDRPVQYVPKVDTEPHTNE
jgi:hypothetical protein